MEKIAERIFWSDDEAEIFRELNVLVGTTFSPVKFTLDKPCVFNVVLWDEANKCFDLKVFVNLGSRDDGEVALAYFKDFTGNPALNLLVAYSKTGADIAEMVMDLGDQINSVAAEVGYDKPFALEVSSSFIGFATPNGNEGTSMVGSISLN